MRRAVPAGPDGAGVLPSPQHVEAMLAQMTDSQSIFVSLVTSRVYWDSHWFLNAPSNLRSELAFEGRILEP